MNKIYSIVEGLGELRCVDETKYVLGKPIKTKGKVYTIKAKASNLEDDKFIYFRDMDDYKLSNARRGDTFKRPERRDKILKGLKKYEKALKLDVDVENQEVFDREVANNDSSKGKSFGEFTFTENDIEDRLSNSGLKGKDYREARDLLYSFSNSDGTARFSG